MQARTSEKLDKKRWLILVLSCLTSICTGSVYSWSVYAGPMEEYLNSVYMAGIAAGGMAVVFTASSAANPPSMIFGGMINDRFGPRGLVFIGGLFIGGGMVLASFARSAAHVVAGYGIPFGIGMAFVYGCNINNCVKWFPERRGFASGMVSSFHGASTAVLSPLINASIHHFGVMQTFRINGIIFMCMICISALFMMKVPDGYRPAGMKVPEKPDQKQDVPVESLITERDYTWRQMMRTKAFWLMWVIFYCGSLGGMMCVSQASVLAQNLVLMNAAAAAVAVSVLAAFNTGGRIIAGVLSDRIGRITVLAYAFVAGIAGIGALLLISVGALNGAGIFFVGICLLGLGYGAVLAIYPALTADMFGTKNNSLNFNIFFSANAAAGLTGPVFMYRTYNAAGGYFPAFAIVIGIFVLGLIMTVIFRRAGEKLAVDEFKIFR